MKSVISTFGAAMALGFVGLPAIAEDLLPLAGHSIQIGSARGIAYYQIDNADFEVIVTIAPAEGGTPVRFIAALRPGQSMQVSAPGPLDGVGSTVIFTREGDRLILDKKQALSQLNEAPAQKF